jgi:hypothetical protein
MAFKMVPKGLGNNSYGESPSSENEKKKYSPTGEMRQIAGSDNPKNFKKEGLGFFGLLSGGAAKQITSLIGKLRGFKPIKSGNKTTGIVELPDGKWTNSIKGVTSTPKPGYGIDQYKYANTKGKSVVERIKNQDYAK